MNLETIFTGILALEALACLVMAFVAWREAEGQNIVFKSVGFLLWCSAAAVIFYGISRS